MRNHLNAALAAATFVVGLTGTVFAQDQQAQPPAAKEQAAPGMMHGQGMMGQEGDGMMPMMKMMTQMSEMMESCNKMMQSKAQDPGTAPQKQGG